MALQVHYLIAGQRKVCSKLIYQQANLAMSFCKRAKKQRPPLKPREGEYKKTNAYSGKPSFQQIFTLAIMIILVVFHSVFNVAAIIAINHPILYVMLALNYLLEVLMIGSYAWITVYDPVDEYITKPRLGQIESTDPNKVTTYCYLCRSITHPKSYHCKRCNRCTQDFDHHCTYLNSCIGGKNYETFLRLVMLFVAYLIDSIGQAIWVFVRSRQSQAVLKAAICEWVSIVIIIISVALIIPAISLCLFHCYISCCLDLSTLEFYQTSEPSERKSESASKSQNKNERRDSGSAVASGIACSSTQMMESPNALIKSSNGLTMQNML